MVDTMLPTPTISSPVPPLLEAKPTPPGGEQPFVLPPAATLPPLTTLWQVYEFPDIGIRLKIPAEWENLRMPGGYIFAANGEYRVDVSFCCEELPRTLTEFREALATYLHSLHQQEVLMVPIVGSEWEGVGVWHLPNTCLIVYIPSSEMIRTITFHEPPFCEAGGEQLVPLGQEILDSVEIFPPRR